MGCQKYVLKYHITNAVVLLAGGKPASVTFYNLVDNAAYLENLSYDQKYKRYSPRVLGYKATIEDLISKKCKYLYLGGGSYAYKTHYGAEEKKVYSGRIYSPYFYKKLKGFWSEKSIKKIAIYGLGKYGKVFWSNRNSLNVSIQYGIDKNKPVLEGIEVSGIEDDWPEIDAIIITIKEKDPEIEKNDKKEGRKRSILQI